MNNPHVYTDPLGLWAIDIWYVYKKDKDGKEKVDGKGRRIVDRVIVTFFKTREDDNGASLAIQLGLSGNEAKKFAQEVDDFTGEDTVSFYAQDAENDNVRQLFTFMGDKLRSQRNRDIKGEDSRDDANCAGTACQLGLRDMMQPSLIQPEDFDKILGNSFKTTTESELKLRDVVRYATNAGKDPKHFTNFIFRTDEGVPLVFSKSGTSGRYETGTAKDFENADYGTITGYYTRK